MSDFSDELKRKAKQNIMDAANAGFAPDSPLGSVQNAFTGQGQLNDIQQAVPATDAENKAAISNADLNDPNSYASVKRRYLQQHLDPRPVAPVPQPTPEQRGFTSEEDMIALANQLADSQMKQDRFKNLKKPRGK